MNSLKVLIVSSACMLFLLVGSTSSAKMLYELSGDLTGVFEPVLGDPIAALLNVNVEQSSESTFPFILKLEIDTNDVPIINSELDINGKIFSTMPMLNKLLDDVLISSPAPEDSFKCFTIPFNQPINGISYDHMFVKLCFRITPNNIPLDAGKFNTLPLEITFQFFLEDSAVITNIVSFSSESLKFMISEIPEPITTTSSLWISLPAILAASKQGPE